MGLKPPRTFLGSASGGRSGYVALLASVAALSGLLFGFDTAVINGALVFLRIQFHLDALQTELAASVLLAGCLVGAACAGRLGDRHGRRSMLLCSAALFAVSAAGAALAPDLTSFCIARFCGGLAIGLGSTLAPIYIAEISPPARRGFLVTINQLAIVIGILCAYLSNWAIASLGSASWRWMFAAGAVPSLAFLGGMLGVPESPRWLSMKGRQREAESILQAILGETEAQTEIDAMQLQRPAATAGQMSALLSPRFRRRLIVAVALAMLQQLSGINTVLYYGSVIMTDHIRGQSAHGALAANVLIGLVNLAGTILAMRLIDRLGRRVLLLAASAGMTACLCVLSFALHSASSFQVLAFGSVLLYVAFFAVGLGPTVWVYIAEIFPTEYRGSASSLAISSLWAATFTVTLTFLSLVQTLGISSTFLFYAIVSLLTLIFIWKFVPETRGLSLEDMESIWNSGT